MKASQNPRRGEVAARISLVSLRASTVFAFGALAAISLIVPASRVLADAGVAPYRRPAQQPIPPTTLGRLRATQSAITQITRNLGPQSYLVAPANTVAYGGYFERARADVQAAQSDVNAAIAFVNGHPELDPLLPGPAKIEITPPKLPAVRPNAVSGALPVVVDGLSIALAPMLNDPAPDNQGFVLGDVGGFRAKIIADLGRAGADFATATLYYNSHHNDSGIIPINPLPIIAPDPEFWAHRLDLFDGSAAQFERAANSGQWRGSWSLHRLRRSICRGRHAGWICGQSFGGRRAGPGGFGLGPGGCSFPSGVGSAAARRRGGGTLAAAGGCGAGVHRFSR